MTGFVLVPRLLGAAKDHPESVYGILGKGLLEAAGVFGIQTWMILLLAVSIILLLISYRFTRKRQVTA